MHAVAITTTSTIAITVTITTTALDRHALSRGQVAFNRASEDMIPDLAGVSVVLEGCSAADLPLLSVKYACAIGRERGRGGGGREIFCCNDVVTVFFFHCLFPCRRGGRCRDVSREGKRGDVLDGELTVAC